MVDFPCRLNAKLEQALSELIAEGRIVARVMEDGETRYWTAENYVKYLEQQK
jgi:hypothetical protein